jgi:hypothetical protein
MEQSLYFREVQKYFSGVAAGVVERINDSTLPANRSYRHRAMLTRQYSPDLNWNSLTTLNNAIVMADVISLDSSLPLKKRDSLAKASGEIPKLGQERQMREKQLTELDILARTPGRDADFVARIFQDTPKVIQAVPETLEYMFLQGLSSGVTTISETNNVGTGIRIDFGYLAGNKFGVPVVWSNTSATPFADISSRILAKAQADGNVVTKLMIDRVTFNRIVATTEAKQLFAFSIGYVGSNLQVPTLAQINAVTQERYGYQFEIVERSMVSEKNGTRTTLTPWTAGSIVALTSNNVGSLQWGTLAEMTHPVPNVNYTTVDDFILVSKFRLNRPSLSEHTSSQALVLPVIEGVDQIYTMDSTTVQA